ncbi:hypothetical protein K461DRAFT_55318 [Myriangium duriaei CBS 260.36]|uniref:Uncharacterized protein n=1 Tax=Myriangium duriaei CBS 260.36 TaxID=1168546 RepID=A0A9P4IW57_9PEZI|nr:hypothetical protein K461DRAFT_55318 [Myriangium duriaei CBS 260.36]
MYSKVYGRTNNSLNRRMYGTMQLSTFYCKKSYMWVVLGKGGSQIDLLIILQVPAFTGGDSIPHADFLFISCYGSNMIHSSCGYTVPQRNFGTHIDQAMIKGISPVDILKLIPDSFALPTTRNLSPYPGYPVAFLVHRVSRHRSISYDAGITRSCTANSGSHSARTSNW